MKRNLFRLSTILLLGATATVACDRSPVDPPGHELLGTVAILDRSAVPQVVLATWTFNGGWDRDVLKIISHADEQDRTRASLGVRMWTRGGEEIELTRDGEYGARYGVAADPNNVVNMDESLGLFHGDHVHVYGFHEEARTGTATLVFVLWHDGHSDGETDPIGVTFSP
jgi:hypothetical protein